MKNWKDFNEHEAKLLRSVKKALVKNQGGTILASVTSVARSGMSRTISYAFVNRKGEVYHLNYLFSKLTDFPMSKEDLRVRGCGMDMVFHTLCVVLSRLGVKDSFKYASHYHSI